MELQWNPSACRYLKCTVREVQNQEQTQEVRLPDGMPDIGRVLCAWGQPVLRGKEWRNDGMTVSGGVTVWVLYAPEDGSAPSSIEVWLPFQGKWNFPETRREGTIRVNCLLRGVDARTLSARKLMVRATVGLLGEALEGAEAEVYAPGEPPEGVQILQKTYPVMLPVEAGEKQILLDQTLAVSGMPRKIIACDVQPMLTEHTALGGKAVFRGNGCVHLVYMGEDDRIYSQCFEIPFAQYTDLDHDYDKEATTSVMMAVSNLESELTEGQIHIKCGLIAQYTIYERSLLEVAEDAYSPERRVTPKMEMLEVPVVLDRRSETLEAQQDMQANAAQVVDAAFWPDHPTQYREADQMILELPGQFQTLYYDADGQLQANTESWSGRWELPAGENCSLCVCVCQPRQPGSTLQNGQLRLSGEIKLDVLTQARQQIPMVSALDVGETVQMDPQRPSLILRRLEDVSLWELAKDCGSTVDAIRAANQLSGDPLPGQMLLIPVY